MTTDRKRINAEEPQKLAIGEKDRLTASELEGKKKRIRPFPLGLVLSTPAALEALEPDEIIHALDRHVSGDWGDCSRDDSRANDRALKEGDRLFSVYHSRKGEKFWVITEADRASTTVLLPGDY